jgi:hypothetical protein
MMIKGVNKTLFLPYLKNKTTSYVTELHYADI